MFFAVDGDSIGAKVGQSVLHDDVEGLRKISKQINAGQDAIRDFIHQHDGHEISGGGDEYVFFLPDGEESNVEQLREIYSQVVGATLSVGFGVTLSQAGKALAFAKVTGKDKTVPFGPEVDEHLIKVHEDPQSEEEQKEDKSYISSADLKSPQGKEIADESSVKTVLMNELNKDDSEDNSPKVDNPGPTFQEDEKQTENNQNDEQVETLKQNIAHALNAMKENKPTLDAMKDQNQSLYYSIVLMIRAMIDMANIIGIKEDDAQPEEQQDSQQTQPQAPQQPQVQPPQGK